MPKAGWAIEIIRDKLVLAYVDHGRSITGDVSRITWTAKTLEDYLPNTHYDEFVRHAKLPATEGTLHWPVSQVCAEGRMDWVELPRPGQPAAELKAPAPALALLPAAGGHQH